MCRKLSQFGGYRILQWSSFSSSDQGLYAAIRVKLRRFRLGFGILTYAYLHQLPPLKGSEEQACRYWRPAAKLAVYCPGSHKDGNFPLPESSSLLVMRLNAY